MRLTPPSDVPRPSFRVPKAPRQLLRPTKVASEKDPLPAHDRRPPWGWSLVGVEALQETWLECDKR